MLTIIQIKCANDIWGAFLLKTDYLICMTNQSELQSIKPLIVTGFSGAGMSSALKHLEDMGYEVFDNFPVPLVDALLADKSGLSKPVAIGIDTRSRGFSPALVLDTVKKTGADMLFLTAEESVLITRFTETRRRHPLSGDRPASAGIRKEHEMLYALRDEADFVVDTSMLSVHDLRRVLDGFFNETPDGKQIVTLMSFGFKHGVPREADMVMDLRFLRNPHWVPELKPLTGLDKVIGAYIAEDEAFAPFVENLQNLIKPLLPLYQKEGKAYLTIALGCTGGRHRSVFTVETMAKWLADNDIACYVFHRDIDRVK